MIALTKRERAESRVCMGYICRGLRRMQYMFAADQKVCQICAACNEAPGEVVCIVPDVKLCKTCNRPGMEYRLYPSGTEYAKCMNCVNKAIRERGPWRKIQMIKRA
jgi:hypothetical protein